MKKMEFFKRNRLSIVMKVSLLAGGIAAMASLIVGTLIVSGSSDIVFQSALSRLKYETNIKSMQFVSDIKNLSGDAQYLAGTPPIKGIPRALNNAGIDPLDNSNLETWRDRLTTIFSELIRAKPNYVQIRYIGVADNGKELVRVNRMGREIIAVDKHNLQNKGGKDYFRNTIKLSPGEVYLSNINLNRDFGDLSEPYLPVIRAAVPVYFKDRVFGVVVINMRFDKIFTAMIKDTPRALTPYVTNEDGYFLAHPDKSMTYGFDLQRNNTIYNLYPEFEMHKTGDLRDNQFSTEINGDVVHVVKVHYDPIRPERFLAVMLATSMENLRVKSTQLWYQSIVIMGFLVLVSLVVAAVLVSRLMRPLRLVTAASEDIAQGREVSNLPVSSGDEIGELARSFDAMRLQLQEKEQELIVSQARVHHANKMASLGEMAAGIAHEINSPIQAISLTAQRVQRQLANDMPPNEIYASMEGISGNVKKISGIIDSLRKVSRDSTGDDFCDVHIEALIEDAVNMCSERFKVNNVCFDVMYHNVAKGTLIQCQQLQISQVLINLINNAYDAVRDKQDKWINVDVCRIDDKIQISVTDNGDGIEEAVTEKIFEPLFTTKEVGRGTGLGLSISTDIMFKHNGRLFLDKEAANTRFVIELPIIHLNVV